MTTTSVGMRCPECAGEKTKVRSISRSGSFGGDGRTLTYALIGINVVVGLGLVFASGNGPNSLYEHLALVPSKVADGEYWRLLTAGFTHGDGGSATGVLIHLLFNMFALYILGGLLEPVVGRLRFGLLYFVSLFAGSLAVVVFSGAGTFTAGASGAVFGLMGGAVIVARHRSIGLYESGLIIWLGLNLLITFSQPGISIAGHIGGLVGGVICAGLLFELPAHVRIRPLVPVACAVVLGLAAIAGGVALAEPAPAPVPIIIGG
jgi:membrane associated rhomboid family serine protease